MSWLEEALRAVDEALVVEPGLQAVSAGDRAVFRVADTRRLDGSCDIDGSLRTARPNEPRWDYVVGYAGQASFVEVHPATSGAHYDEVIAKAKWLAALIRGHDRLVPREVVWVATGRVEKGPAFSRKSRALAELGVVGPRSMVGLI